MSRKKISLHDTFPGMSARIKNIRKSLDLSQEVFGSKIGIQKATVSKYETGKAVPSRETLVRISKVGNISVEWILQGDNKPFADQMAAAGQSPQGELPEFEYEGPFIASSPKAPALLEVNQLQGADPRRIAKNLLIEIVDLMEECLAERGSPEIELHDFIRVALLLYDRYNQTARYQVSKSTVISYLELVVLEG